MSLNKRDVWFMMLSSLIGGVPSLKLGMLVSMVKVPGESASLP